MRDTHRLVSAHARTCFSSHLTSHISRCLHWAESFCFVVVVFILYSCFFMPITRNVVMANVYSSFFAWLKKITKKNPENVEQCRKKSFFYDKKNDITWKEKILNFDLSFVFLFFFQLFSLYIFSVIFNLIFSN